MTRSKHNKSSWRVMKEWQKVTAHISKLCYTCVESCKHESIGELTYCWRYKEKENDDKHKV